MRAGSSGHFWLTHGCSCETFELFELTWLPPASSDAIFRHLLLRWYLLKRGSVGKRHCGVLPFSGMPTRSNIAKRNRDVYDAKQECPWDKPTNNERKLSHPWIETCEIHFVDSCSRVGQMMSPNQTVILSLTLKLVYPVGGWSRYLNIFQACCYLRELWKRAGALSVSTMCYHTSASSNSFSDRSLSE